MSELDLLVAALASRQLGLFTLDQTKAFGATRPMVRHRISTGRWVTVQPGVLRIAGTPETWSHQALAAVLTCPGGAASHRTAAALHRLPGFAERGLEITVPRGGRRRVSGVLVHGSLLLPDHHVTMTASVPATTVPRTLFDLAGTLHPRRTERALDHALARDLTSVHGCWDLFLELAERGRSGTVVMRELLMARGHGYVAPESELEALFLRVVRAHGLPVPERQVDVGSTMAWIGRVDFVYPRSKLVVEVDGRMYHTALLDRAADRMRDNQLGSIGYSVLRFTWADLTERAGQCAQLVERRLRPEPTAVMPAA